MTEGGEAKGKSEYNLCSGSKLRVWPVSFALLSRRMPRPVKEKREKCDRRITQCVIAIALAFREVPRTFTLLFLLLKKPSYLKF